jgi:hypothetical protein
MPFPFLVPSNLLFTEFRIAVSYSLSCSKLFNNKTEIEGTTVRPVGEWFVPYLCINKYLHLRSKSTSEH